MYSIKQAYKRDDRFRVCAWILGIEILLAPLQ
jgi:hypothetical protein